MFFIFGLCDSSLNYELYILTDSEFGKVNASGSNLPPLLPKPAVNPSLPSNSTTGPDGNGLPHIKIYLPEFFPKDTLTERCQNQLDKINSGKNNLRICDPRHTYDCALDTPELKRELCDRYIEYGKTSCRVANVDGGRVLVYASDVRVQARMNQEIFEAIKR